MTDGPEVAVLGAGPAGATAALVLARDKGMHPLVLERGAVAGGNAGSFELEGIWCDYGSHRFHPVAEPRVMAEVEGLLGEDLLWRPRHGRILLQDRWQGLFAHDNTHHTMTMALAAGECLRPDGEFDRQRWAVHQREFEDHVVED